MMTVRATFNTRRGRARIQPLGEVIGWQEVNKPADRDKLKAALPGYEHFIPNAEWAAAIPISWLRDRFTLVDSGIVKAHDGKAGVTPARGCTWVLLQDGADNSLVWHINAHFISKTRLSAWRREQWAKHLVTLRDLVTTLTTRSPLGTIGGDFNNHDAVKFPGVTNLTPKWRGDKVWYDQLLVTDLLAASASVRKGSSRLGSDHWPFMLTYAPPTIDPPEEPDMSAAVRRGTDSSGRTIWATDREWARWEASVFDSGFRPTITQSPWQRLNGGGASASAGYHDFGGTFDLRVWDLTDIQVTKLIRVLRSNGCAAWLRNVQHGGFKDPHIHFVMIGAPNLSTGATWQVGEYRAGRDGLASRGSDYHWRPSPLVLTPTEEMFMPTADEIAKAVQPVVAAEVAKVAEEVWGYKIPRIAPEDGDKKADRMLAEIHRRTGDNRAVLTTPKEPTT